MISMFVNHIWQSTLFALAMGLIALVLRKDGAHIRYWLWQAASIKFLVPFALLVTAGGYFSQHTAPMISPQPIAVTMAFIAQPFPAAITVPFVAAPSAPALTLTSIAAAIWACGFLAVLALWFARWRRIAVALGAATPLPLTAAIPVKSTPSRFEPGVVGIFRPVLLLPEGIAAQLTSEELDSIVAHELWHVRRRDNLTAMLHMLIQALFWFHPLVWWIGGRLVEERERACDEAVVKAGSAPETYAEAILKVCKFYMQSPLACAAGVSGADLKKRIEAIMTNKATVNLNLAKKLLLGVVTVAVIAGPIVTGWVTLPQARAQTASANKQEQSGESTSPHFAGRPIVVEFAGARIPEFVTIIFRDMLQVPYEIDKSVMQDTRTITLKYKDPLSPDEFYRAVTGLLERNYQVSVAYANGVYHINNSSDVGSNPAASDADILAQRRAEQAAVRKEVPIDPKLLDAYVGYYQVGPYTTMTVTTQDSHLLSQLSGQPPVDFYPESDHKFFAKVVAAQISFVTDTQGQASEVVLHQSGLEHHAKRIDEATAKAIPKALAEKLRNTTPSPGTEAALRRQIDGMIKGQPIYQDMEPGLAEATRAQLPSIKRLLNQWGQLKSITFARVGTDGGTAGEDFYNVAFEHGQSVWLIAPLTADGKISALYFHPLP